MTPAWIPGVFAALMLAVAVVSAARLAAARPWRRGSVVADTDVAHLLMSIAMAGMLAQGLSTAPDTAWAVTFGLLTAWFGCRVARDARAGGVRALAGGHCAPHLAHSAAMLYMFLAVGGLAPGRMGGPAMRTLEYPTMAFAFALILAGYSIWDLDQLSGSRYRLAGGSVALAGAAAAPAPAMTRAQSPAFAGQRATGDCPTADQPVPDGAQPGSGSAAGGFLLSPATTVGCRIVMGISMALMLLIMI